MGSDSQAYGRNEALANPSSRRPASGRFWCGPEQGHRLPWASARVRAGASTSSERQSIHPLVLRDRHRPPDTSPDRVPVKF